MIVMPIWLDRSVVATVYSFALLKGGRPERILAVFCGSIWFWNSFVQRTWLGHRSGYELALDVAIFAVTLALAFRFDRWWLLVAGMTRVLRIATDVAAFVIPLHWWAYGTALLTWGYIFLAALVVGTCISWRRRDAPTPLATA